MEGKGCNTSHCQQARQTPCFALSIRELALVLIETHTHLLTLSRAPSPAAVDIVNHRPRGPYRNETNSILVGRKSRIIATSSPKTLEVGHEKKKKICLSCSVFFPSTRLHGVCP
jgi:hypothetical protein